MISTEGHVGRPCGVIQIKPNSNLPGPKKMQHAALVAVSNQAGSGKSSAAVTCWSSAVEELGPSGASGSNALLLPAAVYSRPLWRAPLTSESDALIARIPCSTLEVSFGGDCLLEQQNLFGGCFFWNKALVLMTRYPPTTLNQNWVLWVEVKSGEWLPGASNRNPRSFDRFLSYQGGCLAVSHCPTNVGSRLLPFTAWRHLLHLGLPRSG